MFGSAAIALQPRAILPHSQRILPRGWHAEALVCFDGDDDAMPFSAHVVGPSRLFLVSKILFELGDDLEIAMPMPDGSLLRAAARVIDCEDGEDGTLAGMEVQLDE